VVGAGLLVSSQPAGAQTREPSETELWTEAGLRLLMPKKVSATLTQHVRADEGMSRLDVLSTELALRFRPTGWLEFEGGYRFEHERDHDDIFQDRHRLFINTQLRHKLDPVKLQLRVQWQEQRRQEWDDGTPIRHVLRTRAKASLRSNWVVEPYALVETFQRVDGRDDDVSPWTLQHLRLQVGFERELGHAELDAGYMLVLPIDDEREPRRHILQVAVRFDLAPWKKK